MLIKPTLAEISTWTFGLLTICRKNPAKVRKPDLLCRFSDKLMSWRLTLFNPAPGVDDGSAWQVSVVKERSFDASETDDRQIIIDYADYIHYTILFVEIIQIVQIVQLYKLERLYRGTVQVTEQWHWRHHYYSLVVFCWGMKLCFTIVEQAHWGVGTDLWQCALMATL